MTRGPAPSPTARRRNAPTIPTTKLPAGGRTAPAPDIPSGYSFMSAGRAWWDWAWSMPQAAAWSDGDAYVAARRASLEDDLAAVERVTGLDFDEVADAVSDAEASRVVRRIAALATGRVAIMKEIRELDDRLGLTPKAMTALRWTIVDDGAQESRPQASGDNRRYGHLRGV